MALNAQPMAIFRVITFFIHAIVAAMASMLAAVFTHVLPVVLAVAIALVGLAVICTSCGVGGLAVLRRRSKQK
jgi:hypothetical protein